MNERWLMANRDFMVRDLVRDYCTVFTILAGQRRRFDLDRTVSYTALRDLLGEPQCKGVFWRLKDTAHHLFRNSLKGQSRFEGVVAPNAPDLNCVGHTEQVQGLFRPADNVLPGGASGQRTLEALIDWCIGYAFHECAKLKEDAFQEQHYVNRLTQISRHVEITADMYNPLRGLGGQSTESSSRELARIMHVLGHGLRLLAQYLATERHNSRLVRWLAAAQPLARAAFGANYEHLLASLFGNNTESLYLIAAKDFLDAGRREPAVALLSAAGENGNLGQEGSALLQKLQNEMAQEDKCTSICAACGNKTDLPCLPYLRG